MRSLHLLRRQLLITLAILLCIVPHIAQAQNAKLSRELWAEAEAFRFFASGNFITALDMASTPEANLKFAELGKMLWPNQTSTDAWSLFFRHSLINFVAGEYDIETVFFQHPWADIVLLTAWSRSPKDKRFRIVNIGVAMGSVIRGAQAPFPVGRGWINEKRYVPDAVGTINAKTTNTIARFEAGETNSPIANFGEDESLAMIAGAQFQWMEHQTDILPLLVDEPGTARAMRFAWNEVMAAAQEGRLAEVLPPNALVDAFKNIDPALWGTLEPVAYVETDKGAVSLHTSWRNPDIYAVLAITGDDKQAKITDFDLYRFSNFLKKGKK
ncbi:hypothetical protein ACM5Q9_12390 [Advenella sp. RU8]|uniref:hypothetical protein n=1 Tax=Advenella sp. RU8 TaxID=3399575 RepID=UPI003AADA26E